MELNHLATTYQNGPVIRMHAENYVITNKIIQRRVIHNLDRNICAIFLTPKLYNNTTTFISVQILGRS